MRSTPFSLEVVTLIVLSLIPWPGPTVFKLSCSRDDSRVVRKIIQTKWLPVLERFHVSLPLECPFHPQRDLFAAQDAAKQRHRPSQWTCAFCGKSFYEERALDNHFDRRHNTLINQAEDAVCLAEYCDIMRCGVVAAQGALWGGGGASTDVEVWQDAAAAARALAAPAPRHLARTRGRRSRNATPLPPPTDCPKTEQLKPETEVPLPPAAAAAAAAGEANDTLGCEADGGGAWGGAGDARLAALQAARAACDPAALQRLKLRCERIVHTCVATLTLHLTQQNFHELEEELQRTVCWYLSCDRYWAEAAGGARAFPWALLLALATGLAAALSLCYYIVWLVFESEEAGAPESAAESAAASVTSHSTPRHALDDEHDDQYIYVTYPPDLKRRLMESCYNRTTRL